MEIEKDLISFLVKEEQPLQNTLYQLTTQFPHLNELDLKALMMELVEPLYGTFHSGRYLLPMMIHAMESYLPRCHRESETMRGDLLIKSWILLESFLSESEFLSSSVLDKFLRSWDQALLRLPDNRTRENWLDFMGNHINRCRTIEEVFALGRLGAWTLGMAEFRLSALEGTEILPEGLVEKILLAQKKDRIEARDNPWIIPGSFKGGRFGGFSGFGGPFLLPPKCKKLATAEDIGSSGLILHDQENVYHLFADSFGCRLIGAPDLKNIAQDLPEVAESTFLNVHLSDESHYIWIERRNL